LKSNFIFFPESPKEAQNFFNIRFQRVRPMNRWTTFVSLPIIPLPGLLSFVLS
jgi:hypothetical protein